MSKRDLMTAEVAARTGAAERTVRLWCKQGCFPHAYTEDTPFGGYWKIPEDDLINFKQPKAGRPPKKGTANAL